MRIFTKEITFLNDQRSCRKMFIGSIDSVESKRLNKLRKRKIAETSSTAKRLQVMATPDENEEFEWSDSGAFKSRNDDSNTTDYEVSTYNKQQTANIGKQMRVHMPHLAKACDRHGISDRAAATIATATLCDVGIVTPQNYSKVIDSSKIRRARSQLRESFQAHQQDDAILGLYFDGRKDKTMENVFEEDGKYHRKIVREEHISVVSEPACEYFCHCKTDSGSSRDIVSSLIEAMENRKADLSKLTAMGCDGTAVNTGHIGDVICLMELHLPRPSQWCICLLHANELLLRFLFKRLDGETSGPFVFSGAMGKALATCEKMPIKRFKRIDCSLPLLGKKDLR